MEVIILKLFKVGCPNIALYEEGALAIKKAVMVAGVLGAFPAKTDRVMTPIGCT